MGHRKGDPRPDQQLQISPEELALIISANHLMTKMPRCDMTDPNAIAERYDWYVQCCIDNSLRPGIATMANAFGNDRGHLWRIKEGQVKSIPEDACDMLKRAWMAHEAILEQYAETGKINPVTAIFMLKNHFGYKDQTESVIVRKDPYETGDPEEIARRRLAGMAPALDVPRDSARDVPIVETRIVDQDGKVE